MTHAADAVGYEGAVLAREAHHVRDGAERRHVGVGTPELRHAKAAAELVDELECHARAREVAGGTGVVELGVADGNVLGHEVGRLMVVRHHDVNAHAAHDAHLLGGGDAIVHGDDEVGVTALHHALERLGGQAVALAEAARDVGVHLGAQLAQGQGEQAGGAHAVHVEVAKHGDDLAGAHGPLDPVRRGGKAGELEGVEPVSFERRRKEGSGALGVPDAAGHHHAGR